jgi:hypothetical protein
VADAAAKAIDDNICDFAVKRIALGKKFLDSLHRIRNLEQRAVGIEARSLEQQSGCGLQVDHRTAVFQCGSVIRSQNRAASCGDDQIAVTGEIGNNPRFAIAKPLFALNIENQRDPDAGAGFDLMVSIDKRPLQPTCKLSANRGFSSARHADKVDVVLCTHGRIVAFRNRKTKAPCINADPAPMLSTAYSVIAPPSALPGADPGRLVTVAPDFR